MKFWTAHLRDDQEPVLLREGFSWGALLFGPLWFAAHRAWIPAALLTAAHIGAQLFAPEPIDLVLTVGLAVLAGLSGHDLRRWTLEQRGYLLTNVLAARSEAEAMGRLLTGRPDLAGRFMPARTAR